MPTYTKNTGHNNKLNSMESLSENYQNYSSFCRPLFETCMRMYYIFLGRLTERPCVKKPSPINRQAVSLHLYNNRYCSRLRTC